MEDSNDDPMEVAPEHEQQVAETEKPVSCQAHSKYPGMFRVKRAKGKAFSSGGFGVAIAMEGSSKEAEATAAENNINGEASDEKASEATYDNDVRKRKNEKDGKAALEKPGEGLQKDVKSVKAPDNSSDEAPHPHVTEEQASEAKCKEDPNAKTDKAPINHSFQYLFLEEVLFLHEQGLLECQAGDVDDEKENNKTTETLERRTSPDLYAMLKTVDLSMASYLVFAHLRQQTFRVMRYSPNRIALIRRLEACGKDNPKEKKSLRLQLRKDVQQAPPPVTIHLPSQQSAPTFAFCVYQPDSNFTKTSPGIPDFLVAVTLYGQPALDYGSLMHLMGKANKIPIKLATVSDSGTVIMFGITDFGVPPLAIPATR